MRASLSPKLHATQQIINVLVLAFQPQTAKQHWMQGSNPPGSPHILLPRVTSVPFFPSLTCCCTSDLLWPGTARGGRDR